MQRETLVYDGGLMVVYWWAKGNNVRSGLGAEAPFAPRPCPHAAFGAMEVFGSPHPNSERSDDSSSQGRG